MENNNYSSVKDQAKKGLSTFVLTLSISLIVFSTIYYFMTTGSSDSDDMTNSVGMVNSTDAGKEPAVQGDSSQSTIFGDIASTDPDTTYRQVLAGSDDATTEEGTTVTNQTTQSNSNLNTGVTSITVGLIFALVLFISTLVFVSKDPRKIALSTFERKTTKGL
jgi:hypothetical protein